MIHSMAEDFRSRATIGNKYSEKAESIMKKWGFIVKLTEFTFCKHRSQIPKYRNETDIQVSLDGEIFIPIEVKSKKVHFTCAADWPFRDVTCYAASKGTKDLPVMLFSQVTGDVICLADDGSKRFLDTQADNKRGYSFKVFKAPKELLIDLPEFCTEIMKKLEKLNARK